MDPFIQIPCSDAETIYLKLALKSLPLQVQIRNYKTEDFVELIPGPQHLIFTVNKDKYEKGALQRNSISYPSLSSWAKFSTSPTFERFQDFADEDIQQDTASTIIVTSLAIGNHDRHWSKGCH